MIEALWLTGAALSTALGSAAGWALATRRERRGADARARDASTRFERELDRLRARSADATQRHRVENMLLRGALGLSEEAPRGSTAKGPRLDAVLERLRSVAFVDAAVVADAAGLVLRGEESELAREAASLAPIAAPLCRWQGAPCATEIRVTLADTTHVALRPLPLWAGDALLVAASRGRPPSRLALEASDAMARLMDVERVELPAGDAALCGWTYRAGGDRSQRAAQLLDEIGRFRASAGLRAVALSVLDEPLVADAADGASEAVFEWMGKHASSLARFAGRRMRSAPRRCDVFTQTGTVFSWMQLPDSSRFALVTQSEQRPVDDLDLDRLVGKIRRLTVREPASSGARAPGVTS